MSFNDDRPIEAADAVVSEEVEATIIFDAFLESVQAGHPADPERLLVEHPALADHLEPLIAAHKVLGALARDSVPDFTDYRIVRELGRGGTGIVYEADQVSRGRRVAIKVLTAAAAMDPQQLRRFLLVEVPAAKLLRHPHIVPIVDFGLEHGVHYYAMQFIDGQNLAQLIKTIPKSSLVEIASDDVAHGFGVARSNGAASSPLLEQSPLPLLMDAHGLLRKAARWGLQAAEALNFAHQQGVVHRDIKPSNLLLDARSDVWITDFGLAHIQGEAQLTRPGDLPGTPRYMSPEQAQVRQLGVDHRTDIYSLGATIYELLTLQPAFDGDNPQIVMRRIVEEEPRALRQVNPAIPRDLETIVLKAMAKERDDRYTTAQEFAEDLQRFLDRKPIQARRRGSLDRVSRWARRHRRLVASSVVALVTGVVGLSAGIALIASAERRAVAAGALAVATAQQSQYESLMQQTLRLRLTTHVSGWSDDAWNLIRQASRLRNRSETDWRLDGIAVATLSDLEARPIKHITEFGAYFVAFDRDGRRLLMGPTNDLKGPRRTLGTKLWDDRTQELVDFQFDGQGPVGFRPDGTPIELVADAKTGTLALWDVAQRQILHAFEIPGRLDLQELSQLGMLPDGSLVAAPVVLADSQPALVVWSGDTGQRLQQHSAKTKCVAFSPDHTLVAGGDETGRITTWSVSTGRVEKTFQNGQSLIHCLAFGADRHRSGSDVPTRTGNGWLLAAGDAGGTVTVWDLGAGVPRAYCRGSYFDVYSVAFSPDGTTLASAGRRCAKLWDATTGRHLLDLASGDYTHGLSFSPDSRRLAIGNLIVSGVIVFDLENGRGVQLLRGLSSQVARVIFSTDGRQIAALSHDWRIAIWDSGTGYLKHVLDAPVGLLADNAALAFSPDGRRFAAATGGKASGAVKMWDLASGRELKKWPLPPGMQDTLAFHVSGGLLSCRCETRDGQRAPYSDADPREHPRVCRVRNLAGPDPTVPLAEFREFDWAIDAIVAPSDGTYFVVVGRGGPKGIRVVNKVIDGPTGKDLGAIPMTRSVRYDQVLPLDPGGKVLAISTSNDDKHRTLFAMPSMKMLGTMDHGHEAPGALGPDVRLWSTALSDPSRLSLRGRDGTHLATFGLDSQIPSPPSFAPDGGRLAWGNAEGFVYVANLRQVQRRLAEVDLGW